MNGYFYLTTECNTWWIVFLWLNETWKENVYSFASWDVIKGGLIPTNNLHAEVGNVLFVCKKISHLSKCIMGYLLSFEAYCRAAGNVTVVWSLMIALFCECSNIYTTGVLNLSNVFISWYLILISSSFFLFFFSPSTIVGNFQVVENLTQEWTSWIKTWGN